jgi:uncharacterized membrane protein
MMDGYDMNGWGWFGMAMMVIVVIALAGAVVWGITARRIGDPRHDSPARELLDSRLARAEIDTPEHRELIDALRS